MVVFEATGQLSARASSAEQGCLSLYEFGTAGKLSEGSVHLISDGRDTQLYKGQLCGAQFQGMDVSGGNVLFATDDPLVPGDVDGGQRDVYDARVDGGFPPGTGEASCSGIGCEGPSSTSPVFSTPGSSSLSGSGNFASPTSVSPASTSKPKSRTSKKCKRNQVRRGKKCIRKPKAKAKKANSTRGRNR